MIQCTVFEIYENNRGLPTLKNHEILSFQFYPSMQRSYLRSWNVCCFELGMHYSLDEVYFLKIWVHGFSEVKTGQKEKIIEKIPKICVILCKKSKLIETDEHEAGENSRIMSKIAEEIRKQTKLIEKCRSSPKLMKVVWFLRI